MMRTGGGLVPVLRAEAIRCVGFRGRMVRIATKDRHKAPARPPLIPLSLQMGSDVWGICPIRVSHIIRLSNTVVKIHRHGTDYFVQVHPSLNGALTACKNRTISLYDCSILVSQ